MHASWRSSVKRSSVVVRGWSTAIGLGSHSTLSHNTSHRALRSSLARAFFGIQTVTYWTLTRTANNVTMATTTTRVLLLLGLSFIGIISVARGSACTYRGQGVSSCVVKEAQDVWLERSSRNYNSWEFLLIGKGTDFPLKRSLLQFEDFTTGTDCPTIIDAYMYVYFVKTQKARWHTKDQSPYLSRDVQLHVVNQPWLEDEATTTQRLDGAAWSSTLLALDGSDAEETILASTPMPIASPTLRWIEFKVTDAVKAWADGTKDNNGLLMKVLDEDTDGRDLRFYSNGYTEDTTKHPYINVICSST